MKTQNLSSSTTVILKYFLPLIWTIFFGTLCVIFWVNPELSIGTINMTSFRIGFTFFFLVGVVFFYYTLMRLMRVEIDQHFFYVTNYFKIFKYPFSNIEKVETVNYGVMKVIRIHFRQAGFFGKKVIFTPSRRRFPEFLTDYPELAKIARLSNMKESEAN